ncbi:MAG: 16S rRNA (guanine(966)-N(2))-methyltransferase RsmD [Pseudomonadota bacterium]|nr:16S rRNA (guanine(966)-N(2))-methyltransferase RsmD [Idiomarinaceae bacterium]MEC8926272.1 16S rRNA (guanine(966)-N(2))-methyltransferase RsmD [Pseudomonadota bacterium]
MRKQSNKKTGELRLIAGQWRGRKLPILTSEGLRPTTDRVRETLFNWLQFDIQGAQVVDLFAGSGSLGFEAASRGAQQVTLIEMDKAAARQLNQNVSRLSAPQINVIQQSALDWLNAESTQHTKLDIVFIDPPFNKSLVSPTLGALKRGEWLHSDSLVYVESERNLPPEIFNDFDILREKHHGQVSFRLLTPSTEETTHA